MFESKTCAISTHMSLTNAAETSACKTSMPSVVTWVVRHVDAKAFFERNMMACAVPGVCCRHAFNVGVL